MMCGWHDHAQQSSELFFSLKKQKTNTNKQNQKISNLPLRLVKIIFWYWMINRAVDTQTGLTSK